MNTAIATTTTDPSLSNGDAWRLARAMLDASHAADKDRTSAILHAVCVRVLSTGAVVVYATNGKLLIEERLGEHGDPLEWKDGPPPLGEWVVDVRQVSRELSVWTRRGPSSRRAVPFHVRFNPGGLLLHAEDGSALPLLKRISGNYPSVEHALVPGQTRPVHPFTALSGEYLGALLDAFGPQSFQFDLRGRGVLISPLGADNGRRRRAILIPIATERSPEVERELAKWKREPDAELPAAAP